MQIQQSSVLVSQTQKQAKYNLSFNISLPCLNSSQPFPKINFEISIPNKQNNQDNMKIEEDNQNIKSIQQQNITGQINYQVEAFGINSHSDHNVSVKKRQDTVKVHNRNKFDSFQRERSRTRDCRVKQDAQNSPRFQSINTTLGGINNFFYKIQNTCKKQSFFPLHNLTEGRYKIIDKKYSLNSQLGQFLITSDKVCLQNHRTYIKFAVQNNDCSVGITTFTKDLVKYTKIKNRYMTYCFKTNQMNVREAIYSSKKIEDPNLNVFICLVDLVRKKLVIVNQKQIIRSDKIPEQFVNEEIHLFIELKDKGKIKFL